MIHDWTQREHLRQSFLRFSIRKNHLESLIKTTFLGPNPDLERLGEVLRMCFSMKFPDDADAASSGTTLCIMS